MNLNKCFQIVKEILELNKVTIMFKNCCDDCKESYLNTYNYFTKLHRLKLFKNKTIGVALIDLNLYKTFDEYYRSVNGKNSAAYYSRKALKRGYEFVEINRNDYIDDIYEINTSSEVRQGRGMSEVYLKKVEKYNNEKNYRYFGVISKNRKLVSYCNIEFYG